MQLIRNGPMNILPFLVGNDLIRYVDLYSGNAAMYHTAVNQ